MLKRTVGKYAIIEKIASGGMGDIFKAMHPTLNREVILKRLSLGSGRNIAERFKREAKLMLDFRNDRIVQVYDHFKEGQFYYIAMEFVDGITLSKLIVKKRYLPSEIACLVLYEICHALKYAHDKGVIHRDIKPDNVLISKEGAVKLTDFGIATSNDSNDQCLTREMTLGTPAYMSPEQISDCSNVDKRADIYSLGVVLYEMVTGKSPFPGTITPETINAIQKGKYIKAKKINPRISPVLLKIIKKAMHHNPKRRYRDLGEIIRYLERRFKIQRYEKKIREILEKYIYEDRVLFKKITTPAAFSWLGIKTLKIKVAMAVMVFCVCAGILGYAYYTGIYHEVYMNDRYGALQLELHIKDKIENSPRYIHASLMKKINGRFIADESASFSFLKGPGETGDRLVYRSQRLYVRADVYRLMLDVDNKLYVKEISVKPRNMQKKEQGGFSVVPVVFNHDPVESLPVKFNYSVRDAHTGLDISDQADVYIYYRKQWVRWKDFGEFKDAGSFLVSGRKFYFKIQKEKYYKKIISVNIEPHQSSVYISAEIVPFAGMLMVRCNSGEMKMLINDSTSYVDGGSSGEIKNLKPLSDRYQKILLSPGTYTLSFDSEGRTETQSIDIESGKYTRVIVKKDKNNKSLSFTIL